MDDSTSRRGTDDGRTGSPRGRRGRGTLVVVALAALVVVGAGWANAYLRAGRLIAAVPPLPRLKGANAELQLRLQRARTRALDRATVVDGLAEFGQLCHANAFPAEAETCWRLLLTVQPGCARWTYCLADLRRLASDYAGMAALLAKTTELAPDYSAAWLRLGDLAFKTGRLETAEPAYRRRLALVPDDPYARLGLARVALQQGRRASAREQIQSLVGDVPEFPPGHNLFAEILAAEGDVARATRERVLGNETGRFREADDPWLDELMDACFDYDRLCVRGTVDALTRHGDRGRAFFERAIRIRPDVPAAYELLGNLEVDLNQPARAREIYERGLACANAEKPSAMLYVNLSRVDRLLRQPAEAARVAREGLARAGDAPELYRALGLALDELDEREAAVEAFRKAASRNGDNAQTNYDLAMALIGVHRLDEAMDALHRSLRQEPTFPPTLAVLAKIEADSGRWQAAARYLRPVYDAHPELPEAREQMAGLYLQAGMEAETNGNTAEAERNYRDGVAIDARNVPLQARLGILCLSGRRFTEAVGPLESYHRLDPANASAALLLGQAYAATGRGPEAREVLVQGALMAEQAGDEATARRCRDLLRQAAEPAFISPLGRPGSAR